MLAFEIRINNAAPMIVAADNHVIADFIYGVGAVNPNSVVIAGFDDFHRYVWLDGEIHHNDEGKYIIMMKSISAWSMLTRRRYQFH